MYYKKMLEVSEDYERVYFTFYSKHNVRIIIALPKNSCSNNAIYAGNDFSSLVLVSGNRAKSIITNLMRESLLNHPSTQLCNSVAIKMIS